MVSLKDWFIRYTVTKRYIDLHVQVDLEDRLAQIITIASFVRCKFSVLKFMLHQNNNKIL